MSSSKSEIPRNGVTFWLDCTRAECIEYKFGNTGNRDIKIWWSVDKKFKLCPAQNLHRLRSSVRPKCPYMVPPEQQHSFFKSQYAGIQCDYVHTFAISPPLKTVHTICSYHSFNQLLDHADIFNTSQDRGAWCNFYLFCSSNFSHYPFHTHGNVSKQHSNNILNNSSEIGTLHSGCAHASFRDGQVALDGGVFQYVKHASHWTHSGIAIMQAKEVMTPLQIDQIGAERQCHNYSGVLHEVIVYDRVLNGQEQQQIWWYFYSKYHGDTVASVHEVLSQNVAGNHQLVRLLLSFVMPKGLLPFISTK